MLRSSVISTNPALKTLLSSCIVKNAANSRVQVCAVSARYLSAWVAPNKRGSVRTKRRQPHLINGQAIPFHVKDLKNNASSTPSSSTSSQSLFHYTSDPIQDSHTSQINGFKRQQVPNNNYESDLVVVLDLDECLIHSHFLSTPAQAAIYAHQLRQQRQQQQHDQYESAEQCDSFRVALPDDNEIVHVHIRPGLIDFLKTVTSKYETHIFTAAMPIYAKPVLDYLCCAVRAQSTAYYRNHPIFAGRWYRDHCTYDPIHRAYVKDLSKLPTIHNRLNKTVLVDNNPLSFLSHPENGIWVNSFYTNANDATLGAVVDVLEDLENADDVRPVLTERFQLEQSLLHSNEASLQQFWDDTDDVQEEQQQVAVASA